MRPMHLFTLLPYRRGSLSLRRRMTVRAGGHCGSVRPLCCSAAVRRASASSCDGATAPVTVDSVRR